MLTVLKLLYILAVLELYKQGVVDLTQIKTFGDLTISWLGFDEDADFANINTYEG